MSIKDMLDYKPNIEYTKPEIYSYGISTEEEIVEEDYINFYRNNSIDIIDYIKTLQNVGDAILEYINKKDIYTDIPITEEQKEYIVSMEQLLSVSGVSYQPIEEFIDFDIYKKALEIDTEPYTSYIADIFEEYHAGIDGEIAFELYRDMFEIRKELDDLFGFTINYVCPYIDKDADTEELINLETEMINEITSIAYSARKLEEQISEAFYDTQKFSELTKSLDNMVEIIKEKTNTMTSKSELISVIRRIFQLLVEVTNIIDIAVAIEVDTKEKLDDNIVVALHMSFDNEKKKVKQLEMKRRSVTSREKKKAALRDLGVLSHVKNAFSQPLKSELKNKNLQDSILDRVNDGINTVDEQYMNGMLDCITINETDQTMLMNKINMIIHKHYTRKYIKLREL